MPRVFTDLNLNTGVPARAQPGIGEWGPVDVATTRGKKRQRIITIVVFLLVTAAVFGLGYFVWTQLSGS